MGVQKPVGTPSVIAYFVQGAYEEPYAKVVLRDMKEAGLVSGRAGKDSKSGEGRDALAALRIRHEAIATLTKKLSGEVERRGLALDAKGCYLKQKSSEEYDKAEKARAKEKEKKKEEKAVKKEEKKDDKAKKDAMTPPRKTTRARPRARKATRRVTRRSTARRTPRPRSSRAPSS